MGSRVFIAEFNAEEKLKTGSEYSLPSFSFPNKIANSLIDGMDGLLTCMLNEGDCLITKYKLSSEYLDYWNNNLFEIQNIGLLDDEFPDERNVYKLISERADICSLIKGKSIVEYSNDPDYELVASKIDLNEEINNQDIIRRINKKSYSNELKIKYGLNGAGICVDSIESFEAESTKMLNKVGKILIKDSLGVSGKGLQIIENVSQIERLVRHFKKQKEHGKQIFDFVLEPFLDKKIDFSCHFYIDRKGAVSIQGFQKNNNKGFAYKESVSLDDDEKKYIESSGYCQVIQTISKDLYDLGYSGFVCVDSMILSNGEIVEIVEINPRMSMARFNLNMQKITEKKCCLSYSDISFSQNYHIEDFLGDLTDENILYSKSNSGIIPLAPGTWSIERFGDNKNLNLRVYYLFVYDSEDKLDLLREKTNEILRMRAKT